MPHRRTHSRSITAAVDRRIGNLADRQHGVVGRAQLEAIGLGRSAVLGRIQRGWLRPVHRGVYAVGHSRLSDRGRWIAGVLAGGGVIGANEPPSSPTKHLAVLSHRSAAALHGLMPGNRRVVEITTTTPRPSRVDLRVHRTTLIEGSVTVREGIPCTTVARTLIDIAATENELAARRAWANAVSRNLVRRAEVEHELRRAPRRPGTAFVRAEFGQDYGYLAQRTRSDLERDALRFCRDFDLPRPSANCLVHVGDRRFEADLLWAEPRLIVEVDGGRTHGHAAARRTDRRRDEILQLAGWRTVRIGEWELSTGDRAGAAARLRAALAQAPLEPAPDGATTNRR